MSASPSPIIYTLGHSDRTIDEMLALLRRYDIACLVDVRSQPYSRWVPQFNRETLARALAQADVEYRYMGDTLGGRPTDPALYAPGEEERPDYALVSATDWFREAIARLAALAAEAAIVVMCSEGDHRHCHRALLLAPALRAHGLRVYHILADGETAEEVDKPRQLSLL